MDASTPLNPPVTILRLDHRPSRDIRVSTHLLLAARALGARRAIYTGVHDPGLEESVRKVCVDWGGKFTVEHASSWRRVMREWQGKVVHLTMYGLPIRDCLEQIRGDPSEKLLVVGGSKVPGEVYGLADWNVAVTGQPHSEVSALAVFLHELYEGRELLLASPGARLKVVPMAHGKRVEGAASDL
jgi:tRNA (cytidine56-2'-O)-methyltransferase